MQFEAWVGIAAVNLPQTGYSWLKRLQASPKQHSSLVMRGVYDG